MYANVVILSEWILDELRKDPDKTDLSYQENCGLCSGRNEGRQKDKDVDVAKRGIKRSLDTDDVPKRAGLPEKNNNGLTHQFYGISQAQCRYSCAAMNKDFSSSGSLGKACVFFFYERLVNSENGRDYYVGFTLD